MPVETRVVAASLGEALSVSVASVGDRAISYEWSGRNRQKGIS